MYIEKVEIKNFRLLKDTIINLKEDLSLVIGKNNSGKTSFLAIMEKFLSYTDNRFSFNDFNIETQTLIQNIVDGKNTPKEKDLLGVHLKLYIKYDENDNIANISRLMLDLEPESKYIILKFIYSIDDAILSKLKDDYHKWLSKMKEGINEDQKAKKDDEFDKNSKLNDKELFCHYMKKNHKAYFKIRKLALEYGNETNSIDLVKEKVILDNIINFKCIYAKRNVDNESGKENKKTLSKLSERYYQKVSSPDNEDLFELQKELINSDNQLNSSFENIFGEVINKIKEFGGVRANETQIKIKSTLQEKNILSDNTTVMYEYGNACLPEDYNGLGYMNLISMIFEIELIIKDFKKISDTDTQKPANINMLFIEEPEAHTHPQMQYIFIKNIKGLLSKSKADLPSLDNLQTIITTHSPHITMESDFSDIKYFLNTGDCIISKDMSLLENEFDAKDKEKAYRFLKQYLTINRTELFFADKAILIEGDTERLLLPMFMKKVDIEDEKNGSLPLLSQNISIMQAGGNYSHIFDKLINFLGIKTLIITDLDTSKFVEKENAKGEKTKTTEKCLVCDAELIKNSSLKYFFKEHLDGDDIKKLKKFICLSEDKKKFSCEKGKWKENEDGTLYVCFQVKESIGNTIKYQARSFEDAFIFFNIEEIKSNKEIFHSLKNIDLLDDINISPFILANKCVESKTDFALDVLFHSGKDLSNWKIPCYIYEGLKWLKS